MKVQVKYIAFVSSKFVATVFISKLFDLASASIILSHVITKLLIKLAKYFPCLQLHVKGFQI